MKLVVCPQCGGNISHAWEETRDRSGWYCANCEVTVAHSTEKRREEHEHRQACH